MHDYTPLFAKGKMVGTFRPPDLCQKTVRRSKHLLQKMGAWALDIDFLDQAERMGARMVRLDDSESGEQYSAAIALVRSHGIPIDYKYGRQLALKLTYWSINGKPPQNGPSKPRPTPEASQPSLFG